MHCLLVASANFLKAPDQTLSIVTVLPSDTRLYCGHKYTKKNFEFAQQMVDPHNLRLKEANYRNAAKA